MVALATFLVFSPALHGGFVSLDDDANFLRNFAYRGLHWPQLHWMFTTFFFGPYQPLSWLTYGLDFTLWGMNPFGYHLTNVLLHSANAALFYYVSFRLISLSVPARSLAGSWKAALCSAFAALLFSLHPLRVESVAWVTERRDVLSGFFYLASLLSYLAMCRDERFGRSRRLGKAIPLVFFAAALLSKGSGIGFPITLIVLDVYPLGRLPKDWRLWFSAETRGVLLEKIPYVFLSVAAARAGAIGQARTGTMIPLQKLGLAARGAQVFDSIAFYLRKTAIPLHLMPAYERPAHFVLLSPEHAADLLIAGAFLAALVALRRRKPAVTAAGVHYLAMLLPVLGIVQFGSNVIADRYSYLSCMGWPILIAGWAAAEWDSLSRETRTSLRVGAVACLAACVFLTRSQIGVWHDSGTLWNYVLKLQPEHALANNNLGGMLFERGDADGAIARFRRSLATDPDRADAHNNLGAALASQGKVAEALVEFQESLRLSPTLEAHSNLADELVRAGRLNEAAEQYKAALALDPSNQKIAEKLKTLQTEPPGGDMHNTLGLALAGQGQWAEAVKEYSESLRLKPSAEASVNIGNALFVLGRFDEARARLEAALKAYPDSPQLHSGLGAVFTQQKLYGPAVGEFSRAVTLDPRSVPYRINLAYALAVGGRSEEARAHCQEALKLEPGNLQAQRLLSAIDSHSLGR